MDPRQVKIFHALTAPILLAGVPRQFAIINSTLAAALTFALQNFYLLPIFIVLHLVAVLLTKKDPYFFSVIFRSLRQKSYYDV
jgi:type IV secretory pathway TrbD component